MNFELEQELRDYLKKVTECHKIRNNLHILAGSNYMNVKGECSNELEAELYSEITKIITRNRLYGKTVEMLIKLDYRGFTKIEVKEVTNNTPYVLSYRQQQLNLH